jgi:hypothetical protein
MAAVAPQTQTCFVYITASGILQEWKAGWPAPNCLWKLIWLIMFWIVWILTNSWSLIYLQIYVYSKFICYNKLYLK